MRNGAPKKSEVYKEWDKRIWIFAYEPEDT
jgi:hypothetical protein